MEDGGGVIVKRLGTNRDLEFLRLTPNKQYMHSGGVDVADDGRRQTPSAMLIHNNGMDNVQEFSMVHMQPKMVDPVKQDEITHKFNIKVHRSIPKAEYSGAFNTVSASPDLSASATPNNPFG